MTQFPLDDPAIQDTIDAVFGAPIYDRSYAPSLWDRFRDWVAELLAPVGDAVARVPHLGWALAIGVGSIVLVILGRTAWLAWHERQLDRRRSAGDGRRGRAAVRDPWRLAMEEAGRGNFTDAAHALYAALLHAVARQEPIALHPSKTIGDYARELRQRSSSLFSRFRDFARTYETVIYGVGTCDRERYERLLALATPIVERHG